MQKLIVNVDGGARGNPGPAAIGAVVQGADGEVLEERGERIGTATNNVAEYRALLLGIERAAALGASEVDLVGDSELIVRQVKGEYKVKDAALRELHAEVKRALGDFERWSIRHVRRARERRGGSARQPGARRRLSPLWSVRGGSSLRTDRPRRRHRPRPPQSRRPRPRARLLLRRARLRAAATDRRRRGLRFGRRLPPPHRPQHLALAGRIAATGEQHRPLPRRDPLPDPARAGRSAAPPRRRRRRCSTAPPSTASARRSTSATPTATASSSTGTARARSGHAHQADRASRWSPNRSTCAVSSPSRL